VNAFRTWLEFLKGLEMNILFFGNHYDSGCCGAVDLVSGNAAMNEVAHGLGGDSSCKMGI